METLEPTRGQYDFAIFDTYLAAAEASAPPVTQGVVKLPNGRLGFRIQAFWPDNDFGNLAPPYVPSAKPVRKDPPHDTLPVPYTMPNWNSDEFVSGWEAMMAALGAFRTSRGVPLSEDPRLAYLDVGGYGSYGEWHTYVNDVETTPEITAENAARIINAAVTNFPSKFVIMMTAQKNYLKSALDTSQKVGLRIDCLGNSKNMGPTITQLPGEGNDKFGMPYADRWQIAPFLSEWCHGGDGQTEESQEGLGQVTAYHFSTVSSGNFPLPLIDLQEENLTMASRRAGYRLRLVELGLPDQLVRGQNFNASWAWANDGSAPTYDNWNVLLHLKDTHGSLQWTAPLPSVKLRTVLPTSAREGNDALAGVPNSVPAGSYIVAISVIDVDGYLPRMNLAIDGRRDDGSYDLGEIEVV